MPEAFRSKSGLFEKIVIEWKKLVKMDVQNAKLRYVQLARSLKTYGITIFSVIERVQLSYCCIANH